MEPASTLPEAAANTPVLNLGGGLGDRQRRRAHRLVVHIGTTPFTPVDAAERLVSATDALLAASTPTAERAGRARRRRGSGTGGVDKGRPRLLLKPMLNHQARLDAAFRALADPGRRAMVERLSQGPASVGELARPLAMSLPAVMQHLRVLEESGLVRSEKIGRVRTCRIEPAALRPVEAWIEERRASWERRLDRLGEVLAEDDPPS